MIETITLITLSVLFLVFFRPGKTPPLESPLVIERIGQFRATLAPKLNLAQPLLEKISKNLSAQARAQGDTDIFYFSIVDREVKAHGANHYLLAATLQDGTLNFIACPPQPNVADRDAIVNMSSTITAKNGSVSEVAATGLLQAIQETASQASIRIEAL